MFAWILAVPRKWTLVAFMVLMCVAARQRVVVATLDFDFIRLLVIVGWIRVFMRGELRRFTWKPIDTVFALWCIAGFVAYVALHQSFDAVKLQLGQLLTIAGGYYLFRALITNFDDLVCLTRATAVISAPIAACIMFEKFTGRNLFSYFGGVPPLTQIRYGELRAQGAFAHPILAGCFWAALTPYFVALWWRGGLDKVLAVVGTACAVMIAVASASSTPLVSIGAGAFAGGMFVIRRRMRAVRWGIVLLLIALQIVKTRPVWHMYVYADLVGGSTGWHRFHLVDRAIKNFPEWMLFGTKSTAHWGPGLRDVTNQFVLEGVRGGFLSLVLFVMILVLCFAGVGRLWRLVEHRKPDVVLAWAIGVAMFVHFTSFHAVSYFGQIVTLLTMQFAIIGSLAPTAKEYSRRMALRQDRVDEKRGRSAIESRRPRAAGSHELAG